MEYFLLVITLAVSVGIGILASGLPQLAADPGGPSLFPLACATLTGVACVLRLGQLMLVRGSAAKGPAQRPLGARLLDCARTNARQLGVVLLVLLFPLAIEYIGFNVAVFAFTFLVLFVSGKSLKVSIITSALITAGVYLAFAKLLGAVLPQGLLMYQWLN